MPMMDVEILGAKRAWRIRNAGGDARGLWYLFATYHALKPQPTNSDSLINALGQSYGTRCTIDAIKFVTGPPALSGLKAAIILA